MRLRYNYRVYPSPGQRVGLARAFGCARVVFNDGLRARQEAREAGLGFIKDTDLQKQVITTAKSTDERRWLSEVSSVVLVQSLRDLHCAYRNFFHSVTGQRRGPKVASPRFKSRKDNRQSIRLTSNGFCLRGNGRLYVAKIGELKVTWSRRLPCDPKSVTITKDAAGRYFASWHLEQLDALVAADATGTLLSTDRAWVDASDEASRDQATRWWQDMTATGGEGMVVKPREAVVRGANGVVQPGIKVRGREYLRIIYGPDYTEPQHLRRLRQRSTGRKRSMAAREFALGMEALDRLAGGAPLWRVHEAVFGVLALESEPVDPRL